MPGIVGLITKRPREWAEPQLARMIAAVSHESFYRVGMWIDESLGLYAGWTAIEGSFADGMPLRDPLRKLTLIFSGEAYQRSAPAEKGDSSPCAFVLRLAADNPDFASRLNGLFHGLLVDSVAGSVTLFNDRYGMHRLCFHESQDAFYFAAEAKAILAARSDLRVPSEQSLGEFLACSCVLENRTIFRDIAVMPAASSWTFRNAALKQKEIYFTPDQWESQERMDADAWFQAVRKSISNALPNYFAGRQSTGIALTGGLDTRVILAQSGEAIASVPAYTFGSMFRDCRDVQIARKVADACHQRHQVITVGKEFLSNFPHYAERTVYLTEGGVDVYRASDLYVSEKARQIAQAKVVGTYGSEIVRHAVMFKPMLPADILVHGDLVASVQQANETYHAIRRIHPVTFAAFRQSPWYHHGVLALEQSQLTVRSPFLDNEFVAAVYRAPATLPPDYDIRLRLIGDGNPVLRRIPSDRGVGGSAGLVTSTLARAWGEFTFKAEYACDYGMPNWVTRLNSWIAPMHLERALLGRHKFLHYRVWYRDALARYVQEILLDSRTSSRPFLNRKTLEPMVRGHLRGTCNSTTVIHKLLSMELLFRQFFDTPPIVRPKPMPEAFSQAV